MFAEGLKRARAYMFAPGLGPLFVRSLAGSSVVRIASMLASFAVGVQLARGLGVSGYGYYGLALSIVTIGAIPGELGLSRLVTREVSTAAARGDDAGLFAVIRWADRTCWTVSGLIAIIIAIAAGVLIARGSTTLGMAVLLGIPTIPFIALSRIRGGALQGLHYITLGQVPANLLRPLFLSLLLFGAYLIGAMTPSMGMALSSVSALIVYIVAFVWLAKRLPTAVPPAPVHLQRQWLASTIPLALTDGMRMLQLELTTLILGLLTIPADVGLFRIATVTATVAAAPLLVIGHTTMPIIARLHAEGDSVRLQKVVTYSAWLQTAGVFVMSLPLLIAPELLLTLVFGPGFAPAANAMRIVAVGQIANAAFGPNVVLLNMTNQERRVTRAMIIGVALNAITVLLLAAALGPVGAALGFVASLLCWNVITWLDARRILGIETSVGFPRLAYAGARKTRHDDDDDRS